MQHEAVVKVMPEDIAGDEAILRSLDGLRADLAGLKAGLAEAEEIAKSLQGRERCLRLVHGLGRELVRVHEEWVDAVERELGRVGASP